MAEKFFKNGDVVGVLTPEPFDRILDYHAPENGCKIGSFVEVPLGKRRVLGVVWGDGQGDWNPDKLRRIVRVFDVPAMPPDMRDFLERAGAYTLTPLSAMLRLATRVPGLGDPPSMRKVYQRGTNTPARLTNARKRVLKTMATYNGGSLTLQELSDVSGVTPSVVKGLVQTGAVVEYDTPRDIPYAPLDANRPGKTLTPDQAKATQVLQEAMAQRRYSTTLLQGVTGSGKTEVYLEAVAQCLRQGRQALVLLPEIALSAEFITRVEARFGAKPAEWHSGVPLTERRRCWSMLAQGQASLVVGARSALFLPFRDLGLVVVDEEHDGSYKQEDGVLYNARDMAVLRASLTDAQVILASATPSLETWANAESGKYKRLDLPARFGAAALPTMQIVDMRGVDLATGSWISPPLAAEIAARLRAGEQSLLFLNRRGYAPVTLCRACGQQIGCDHCDARMVEHRFQNRLVCHQCGETKPIPQTCPACGVTGKMTTVGPGVERVAEEITHTFPQARVAVLSSDLFGSARALKDKIHDITQGNVDIIIGTQLVAKGHNFPHLTLVGVIDADLGLQGSDLRAAERTFQLMRQVAGRAGRRDTPGVALLQSFQPDHPVLRAILNDDGQNFWRTEAAARQATGMPPFGRLAGIVISCPHAPTAHDFGRHLARTDAPLRAIGAQVYGPAPAPIARVRGRYRVRLLVKAPKTAPLQSALHDWTAGLKRPKNLRLSIDIDPQSFF